MTKRMTHFICKSCNSKFPRPERKKLYCSVECHFWGNVNKTESCWLWTAGGHKFGYGEFRSEGKLIRTHRYSYELHKGEIPEKMGINHTCDNPKCVNPDHLYSGTQADNCHDTSIRNRVGGRKLTASDVKNIKSLISNGKSLESIGREYKVTGACIGRIKDGKNWRHL